MRNGPPVSFPDASSPRHLIRVDGERGAVEGTRLEAAAAEVQPFGHCQDPAGRGVEGRAAAARQDDAVVDTVEDLLELRLDQGLVETSVGCRPWCDCLPHGVGGPCKGDTTTIGSRSLLRYPSSRAGTIPRIGDPPRTEPLTPPITQPVTCIVADDHPAVLEAVAEFLALGGIEIVARARDGEEALEKIEARKPAVALVDVRMPKLGGIELTRRAQRSAPETAILLYTGYGDRALLTEALDAGVRGFVLKEAPMDDLLRAVQAVADGSTYVDPVLAGTLATSSIGAKLPQLTQRERDVLRLLADGLANEEIGKRLFISAETVRTHVRKAMDKLDADTRTQAVAKALREQLIS